MLSDNELTGLINEAAKGLLFPSEMDYPFEVTLWASTETTDINEANVLKLTGKPSDSKIEQYDFDTLFYWTIREQDWHSEKEKETVKRFQDLIKVIKDNIKDIKVFRIGSVEIEVFIVGRAPSGNLICISTKQLQT